MNKEIRAESFPMKQKLVEALPMLRTFARSLTGSAEVANDMVQEAIAKALANRDKFKPGTNFEAWLVTILRNHYYSECRKKRREVEDADGVHAGKLSVKGGQTDHLEMQDFLNALQLIKLAVSLGGTESLAEHPGTMTHADVPPDEQERMGITPGMVRISVGVEHYEDVILDVQQALEAV